METESQLDSPDPFQWRNRAQNFQYSTMNRRNRSCVKVHADQSNKNTRLGKRQAQEISLTSLSLCKTIIDLKKKEKKRNLKMS